MSEYSPAVLEIYGDDEPHFIDRTKLREDYLPGFSHGHCYKDRDLAAHESILGFTAGELPPDSRLLVIGAGTTRRFERELNVARPDLAIVSVDPLLRYGPVERMRESVRMGGTRGWGSVNLPRELETGDRYYRAGAVCGGFALAHANLDHADGVKHSNYLPFIDGSFQTVVALHSLPQYSLTEEVPAMLDEVRRVLAPEGHAMLFPILMEDEKFLRERGLLEAADLKLVPNDYVPFDSPRTPTLHIYKPAAI
jgi:hypothetical protein